MAQEVKPDTIKKTQTALNKYIKKPPLSDKLLKKPPFRFLHDIITSVIKETGFLKDIFTSEELVADNIKDRDSKIKFLTKLINAVKEATGISIKAKPGKIVAGLEPDKTLELLQAVAKGITLQTNGKKSSAVQDKSKTVKESSKTTEKETSKKNDQQSGENTIPEKPVVDDTPANAEEETPKVEQNVLNGAIGEPIDEEVKEKVKKKERKNSAVPDGEDNNKEKKRRSAREKKEGKEESKRRESFPPTPVIPNGNIDEATTENSEKLVNGTTSGSPVRRRSSSRIKKGASSESQEKIGISVNISEETDIEINNKHFQNGVNEVEKTSRTDIEISDERADDTKKKSRSKEASDKSSREKDVKINSSEKKDDDDLSNKKEVGGGDAVQSKRPTTRRASTRSSRQPLKALAEKDGKNEIKEEDGENKSESKGELKKKTDKQQAGPITLGSSDIIAPTTPTAPLERPMTARRAPPSARPGSARPPSTRPRSLRPPSSLPGAPTARDRGEVDIDINRDPVDSEIKEVAVITENEKIEDKEEMVVMENKSLALNEEDNILDVNSAEMEGALVQDILETQIELEKRRINKPQVDIEWEGGNKEKSEAWKKECEKLRQGVQALTRASGPLGKLFDFLQEDVDLAARELASWRQASKSYTSQLAAEQRMTDETLSQHRKKLTELDSLIEEQYDAIRTTKASIISNDKKIQAIITRPQTSP